MTPPTHDGLSLVVLAAGIGSRFGGLKQLEAVGPSGETLLEYSVFDALRSGFDRLILIVRPETEVLFRQAFRDHSESGLDVQYVPQRLDQVPEGFKIPDDRTKPWGTGHAVLAAESVVNGPFVAINADDFYGLDAFRILADFMKQHRGDEPTTFAIPGFQVSPTLSDAGPVSRGLCRVDDAGWLTKIVEILKLDKAEGGGTYIDASGTRRFVSGDDLVSMNMWGFTPAIFPELRARFRTFLDSLGAKTHNQPEFLLPDIVQKLIDGGTARVRVLRHDSPWCGITFPEDLPRVRDFITSRVRAGDYPSQLWRRDGS